MLIYDSKNLPLSPLKPVKKTIANFLTGRGLSILITLIFVAFFTFNSYSEVTNIRSQTTYSSFNNSFYSPTYHPTPFYETILQFAVWIILSLIIIIVVDAIYQYFYYKLYFYQFDDEQGQIKKGVISRATGYVRYGKLQNVYVDQDFLDRLFGLYDVHYETAGEVSGFYSHVDGLNKANAEKLTDFLNSKAKEGDLPKPKDGPSEIKVNVAPADFANQKNIDRQTISSKITPLSPNVVPDMTLSASFFLFIIFIFSIAFAPYSLAGKLLFIVVSTIVVITLSYLYASVWYKNFYFEFGSEKGEVRTKVIGQKISYIYYNRIQNVMMSQGVIDRIFGLYTVAVETAGGASSRAFRLIGYTKDNAEKIRDFLLAKAKNYRPNL